MAQMQPFISSARERLLRASVCENCLPLFHANPSQPLNSPSWKRPAYPRYRRRHHYADTRRHQSTTTREHNPAQAYPLKGYYSDILSTQYPSNNRPTQPETGTHKPEPTPESDPQEKTPAEKMSIVFGTRLAGPGYSSRYNPSTSPESTWRKINGVPIPPRPDEPDNCCMSGCVHCVWDDYRDEVEDWAVRVREAKMRGAQEEGGSGTQRTMQQKGRREVESASLSMDDDGGGSETNWSDDILGDDGDLFSGIPVGIREFMKTEKRLKERKRLT